MLQGRAHGFSILKALRWILLHSFYNHLFYRTDKRIIDTYRTQTWVLRQDAACSWCLDGIWLIIGEQMIHGSAQRVNVRARIRLDQLTWILGAAPLSRRRHRTKMLRRGI